MNLSGYKKTAEDKKMVTMSHPKGHTISIMKSGLSALQRKQVEKLPLHLADGTADVDTDKLSDTAPQGQIVQGDNPTNQYLDMTPAEQSQAVQAGSPITVSAPTEPTPFSDAENKPAYQSAPYQDPNAQRAPAQGQQAQSNDTNNPIDLNDAYKQAQNSITQQQGINQQLSANAADLDQQRIQESQDLQKTYAQNLQGMTQAVQNFANYNQNNPINPKHYQENQSTGAKVASAIGLLLGGISGGMSGHGGNPASDFLNKQIDRDIAAQEARAGQQRTLLGANQDLFHDQTIANNATRINMNDIYAQKIKMAADQLGTPQAQANANAELSNLAFKTNDLLRQNALYTTLQHQNQTGDVKSPVNANVNYSKLNLLQATKVMPQPDVEAATKEASALESSRSLRSDYDSSFNDLNNKFLKGALTPADRAANINTFAAKLTKQSAGRFNLEESKQIIDGMFPSKGDLASTDRDKQIKAHQFFDTLDAETPTLNRYGLKNPVVSQAQSNQTKMYNGVKYMRGPNGIAVPVK